MKQIDYLRISVTDRCNLRCIYCMPEEGIVNKPHDELLTFEEIIKLVKIFTSIGIRKIRLTGGEPLVRNGIIALIQELGKIDKIEELALTTNGELLSGLMDRLKKTKLKRINISLDTLKPDRFKTMTRGGSLEKVIDGINLARSAGFRAIKLNTVVMKGVNDDEIIDFADFAFERGVILRFIEFMNVTPLWREKCYMPIDEIRERCALKYKLHDVVEVAGSGPAVYYAVDGKGTLGFINTNLDNCNRCSRLRLTSTGELKTCLYEPEGLYLKNLLRNNVCTEEIRDIVQARVEQKNRIDYRLWNVKDRCKKIYMSSLGG